MLERSALTQLYAMFPRSIQRFCKSSYSQIKILKKKLSYYALRLGIVRKISNLEKYEMKIFSQNGEDGIIRAIFCKIRTTNKFCVEFGVGDGSECNTRSLIERGRWHYLHMDGMSHKKTVGKQYQEFITAENINELFCKYKVPREFDLLSIDIDFNDYWVWKAIVGYAPRVVIIEYNSSIPPTDSKVVWYEPTRTWDCTNYFGASLLALSRLGESKGYRLIGCERTGVNAFFVRRDIAEANFDKVKTELLYRPPKFGARINGHQTGHPQSSEKMVSI